MPHSPGGGLAGPGAIAARDVAQAKEMGKPEPAWTKIVEGKLEKFYQESCLLEQAFIKDPSVFIKDMVAQKIAKIGENISVRRFTRYQLGQE